MTTDPRLRDDRPLQQPHTDLDRGQFSDGVRTFTVRASGHAAPDSFQVLATDNPAEVVLVISGLNSGTLRATWGDYWRTASEAWREWCEAKAFMVFHNGQDTVCGKVRTCEG